MKLRTVVAAILLACAALILSAAPSEARARHGHRHHVTHHLRHAAARYEDGRPSAWCGWFLGRLLGLYDRKLWLAANWAKVGRSAGGPQVGAVVVWQHHVGLITGRSGNQWVVKSGNDGHQVRERPRSVASAIAFRVL